MTIREAINMYTKYKANCITGGIVTLTLMRTTSLCFTIPLNNGVCIFIDTHPEIDDFAEKYPQEYPNKNGVCKRVSFEIGNEVEPVLPKSILKYTSKSHCNGILYYVDAAKERDINEFINANGGINKDLFEKQQKALWEEM